MPIVVKTVAPVGFAWKTMGSPATATENCARRVTTPFGATVVPGIAVSDSVVVPDAATVATVTVVPRTLSCRLPVLASARTVIRIPEIVSCPPVSPEAAAPTFTWKPAAVTFWMVAVMPLATVLAATVGVPTNVAPGTPSDGSFATATWITWPAVSGWPAVSVMMTFPTAWSAIPLNTVVGLLAVTETPVAMPGTDPIEGSQPNVAVCVCVTRSPSTWANDVAVVSVTVVKVADATGLFSGLTPPVPMKRFPALAPVAMKLGLPGSIVTLRDVTPETAGALSTPDAVNFESKIPAGNPVVL